VKILDGAVIESLMAFVALLSLSSWIPQIGRMIERKTTDDFSLWTTVILLFCNSAWWLYALYINSISFLIQQSITLIMLLWFGALIIKYRTTPLFFRKSKAVKM
jgi:uncharacterized protein with PQ loop repeat